MSENVHINEFLVRLGFGKATYTAIVWQGAHIRGLHFP